LGRGNCSSVVDWADNHGLSQTSSFPPQKQFEKCFTTVRIRCQKGRQRLPLCLFVQWQNWHRIDLSLPKLKSNGNSYVLFIQVRPTFWGDYDALISELELSFFIHQPPISASRRQAVVHVRNSWTCFGKNPRSFESKGSSISK
jgi:hypothetical protein